jgi:pilus assembly protein CpaE
MTFIVPDNMENLKKAMHMGASDVLRFSYTTEELKETIIQAIKYMEHRSDKELGVSFLKGKSRVIAVSSPKGGVGRTSLTVNLALSLAKTERKVAVVDGNIQFGDIAMHFNEKPKRTLYEWVKEAYGRSNYTIDQYMVHHASGVSILAAPPRPEFFEGITENHLITAVEEIKKQFDVVLIDMPGYLSEIHMSCLDLADDILIILTNNLPEIRIGKLYLETLEAINLQNKVKVIVNKSLKRQGVEEKKMEDILGAPIYLSIPEQGKVAATAISTGIPFVLSNPRNPLSRSVFQLSEKLYKEEGSDIIPERKRVKRKFLLST